MDNIQHEEPVPDLLSSGAMGDKELKKKLRNRQSAQRARDRQKARMRWLEREISVVTLKNQTLQRENLALKEILQKKVPAYATISNKQSVNEFLNTQREVQINDNYSDISANIPPKKRRIRDTEYNTKCEKSCFEEQKHFDMKREPNIKKEAVEELVIRKPSMKHMSESHQDETSHRHMYNRDMKSPYSNSIKDEILAKSEMLSAAAKENSYGLFSPESRGLHYGAGSHIAAPLFMAPILAPHLHPGYGIFPLACKDAGLAPYTCASLILGADKYSNRCHESYPNPRKRPTSSYESETSSHMSSDNEAISV